jgi:hypothetical protein
MFSFPSPIQSLKITSLLVILALGACVNHQKMAKQPSPELELEDEQQAKRILSGDQVFCEGECPDSVASFFLYHHPRIEEGRTRHSVVQCSATLIAKDKILTNYHCIENLLKEGDVLDPNDESISIEIKFPKTKNAAFLSVKAKKILKTSKDFRRRLAPDWAIVQLAANVRNREPVQPAKPGSADGAAVNLFPVYFDNSYEPVAAVIKQVKCEQSFDNPVDIFSTDSQSPLFRVINCDHEIVSGNSGTGVFLAAEGGLLGVMATSGGQAQSASGTSAHCLPDLVSGSEGCYYSDDSNYTEISKQLSFLNGFIRDRDLSSQDWSLFPGFHWKEDSQEDVTGEDLASNPKLEFNAPWSDYLAYLDNSADQKLKQRFMAVFAQALFPKNPSCIEKDYTTQELLLPAMNMEIWDLRPFEWKEEPVGDDGRSGRITYTPAPGNSSVMPVKVSAKKDGKYFIFESAGELPQPLKNFSWRLPICSE